MFELELPIWQLCAAHAVPSYSMDSHFFFSFSFFFPILALDVESPFYEYRSISAIENIAFIYNCPMFCRFQTGDVGRLRTSMRYVGLAYL